jgi:hypothetical protein
MSRLLICSDLLMQLLLTMMRMLQYALRAAGGGARDGIGVVVCWRRTSEYELVPSDYRWTLPDCSLELSDWYKVGIQLEPPAVVLGCLAAIDVGKP